MTTTDRISHQESFFGVAAEDVAANQEAQDGIRQLMAFLCPAGGSTGTPGPGA